MDPLSLILSFIFGAVIGSFLNVVSLRHNTGKGLGGRSACMACGNTLTWKELVPIMSFVAQRGACRKCKSRILWQYPLVEFLAGALFVLIFLAFPPATPAAAFTTLLYVFEACLLLIITVYDIRHKIIPDQFVYVFIAAAATGMFVGGYSWFHVPSLWNILAGPILALPFALIWLVSGGKWIGLGDAKLTLGIGWVLGFSAGVNALVLAFWIAAAVSLIWILVRFRKFKPGTEVPFGPYLILGLYLVLLFNIQVLDVHLLKAILMTYM